MLLSERKNKRYVIVIDQYDDNLGRYIPKSHTVEAPTLVEAIINCEHFRQTSMATHPSNLLSVREAKVYPQSFMDADQHNMISVLKELAPLGNIYLSNGAYTRHLTYDRNAKGLDGLAALICGIRDMLRPIV